jgi:hypothetical protein
MSLPHETTRSFSLTRMLCLGTARAFAGTPA